MLCWRWTFLLIDPISSHAEGRTNVSDVKRDFKKNNYLLRFTIPARVRALCLVIALFAASKELNN